MRSAAIRESTALLSFSLQGISNRLKATPGEAALGRIAAFINYRVLEHVSHNAEYLLGHGRAGPLGVGSLPWPDTLTALRQHCELISVDARRLRLTAKTSRVGQSRRGTVPCRRPPTRNPCGGQIVGPVGLEPTTRGLKVRCSAN